MISQEITAVITDDEACFREMIQLLLADYFPQIKICATAGSVDEAVAAIDKYQPSLVFLDIEITGGTGFQVLRRVKNHQFKLIVVTAFNEFAIQAIKFSAIDYILKPVNEFEFKAGVEKAIQEIEEMNNHNPLTNLFNNILETETKKLVLRTSNEIHVVSVNDIIRLHADNAYTTFYLETGEKIIISRGIGEYDNLLSGYGFIRPHQSHLVNIRFIKKLDRSDGGFLILKDKTQVPVSARKRQHLLETLNKL